MPAPTELGLAIPSLNNEHELGEIIVAVKVDGVEEFFVFGNGGEENWEELEACGGCPDALSGCWR